MKWRAEIKIRENRIFYLVTEVDFLYIITPFAKLVPNFVDCNNWKLKQWKWLFCKKKLLGTRRTNQFFIGSIFFFSFFIKLRAQWRITFYTGVLAKFKVHYILTRKYTFFFQRNWHSTKNLLSWFSYWALPIGQKPIGRLNWQLAGLVTIIIFCYSVQPRWKHQYCFRSTWVESLQLKTSC